MGIPMEEHLDLLTTTLPDLPKDRFEIMWTNRQYEFNRVFSEQALKIDGGTSVKRNVVMNHTGQAQFRQMFDTDQFNVDYVHQQIDVPWTMLSTKYAWDIGEIIAQRGGKGYINLLEERMQDALWAWADLIEDAGWNAPTSASDNLMPYGLPYYLNKLDAGSTTDGFNGKTIRYLDGSTGTDCAGLDASLTKFKRWRNYAATYTAVNSGLMRKMRTAFRMTKFKAPRIVSKYGQSDKPQNRFIYVNGATFDAISDMADKRDDSSTSQDMMGSVRVRQDGNGNPYINGNPMVAIDQLDADADDAIYAVDWSKIRVVTQEGYWLEEGKPKNPDNAHTTFVVNVDGRCCILCTNRREAGFVLHKAIAA